jgi:hypothetical protein
VLVEETGACELETRAQVEEHREGLGNGNDRRNRPLDEE